VTAAYALLTLATTWPLVTQLTRSLPSDFGDPLLNCFIIDWGVAQVRAIASGDLGAFHRFWHAPMFHPEPLTLAYSEHLFAQAVQAAPVHALSGNILLCYNLLFLSTFVLSALGMYLLSRELTGSATAGFVAGLLYGFALYRLAQFPHLQTMSSQWLPFALYGLRRFFATRRLAPLAGATAALIAQNLSNGYYLIFFAPLVAAYCIYEIADRGLWTSPRVLAGVVCAGLATVAATLPFLVPYLALRTMGFAARDLIEVSGYSADVLSWMTAPPGSRLWGWLQTFPKPEGELFPGLAAPVLALIGIAARVRTLWRPDDAPRGRRRAVAWTIIAVGAVIAGFAALTFVTNDPYWRVMGVRLTLRQPWKAGVLLVGLTAALALVSPRTRHLLRGVPGSALGFFAVSAAITALLTLGPVVEVAGAATAIPALYAVLYAHVPGFDGLRVPSRYVMATLCCLAVVGGFGVRALLNAGRGGRVAVAVLALLALAESTGAPITLDRPLGAKGYASAPDLVAVGSGVPEIYRRAAELPPSTVIIEFPFASSAWNLHAIFYQRVHQHPVVNGYSGGFPASFDDTREAIDALAAVPDLAWRRVLESGATHAIVHGRPFRSRDWNRLQRWLTDHGATLLATYGTDRLYALPAR
jgi:hypothetical protein